MITRTTPICDFPYLVLAAKALGKPISCFDLETTTFGGDTFGITECAVAVVSPNGTIELHQSLVNPENPIHPMSEEKTGISNRMVADQLPWHKEWASLLSKFSLETYTSGWNSSRFDVPRAKTQYLRYNLPVPEFAEHLDINKVVFSITKNKKGTLSEIAERLGIPSFGAHRAGADVLMTLGITDSLLGHYGLTRVFGQHGPLHIPFEPIIPLGVTPFTANQSGLAQKIANHVRDLGRYDHQALLIDLSISERDLDFALSEVIQEELVHHDFFANKDIQAWIDTIIDTTLARVWVNGERKLKPLKEALSEDVDAPPHLSYVQIWVALKRRGLR